MTVEDLRRFMALCGAEQSGPLGVPWRDRPLGEAPLAVRAACLKGYYLDVTTREGINEVLREALSARRSVNGHDRDRSALGHLMTLVPSNPLSGGAPPRRKPPLAARRHSGCDGRSGPNAPFQVRRESPGG